VVRSPQQNGVVERRNRTLIEAARTILIYSQAPLFLWAEAVATACFTQNRSIICLRHGKTPYELMHGKQPDLSFFHVFGALCYPTNDSENVEIQSSVILQDVGNDNLDIEVAHMENDLLLGVPIPEVTSEQSSSTASPQSNVQPNHPMTHHNSKWTKDHPLNYIIDANATPVTPGNEGTSKQQPRGEVMETFATVPEDNQNLIIAEAEAVQIILRGSDNDIYSTVDACPNAIEMWEAIERLKQANGIVTNHQVNVQFLLKLKPEWHRGKAIVNSPQRSYVPESEVVVDNESSLKEKETDKLMVLILIGTGYDRQTRHHDNQRIVNVVGDRKNVGTHVVQQTRIQCYNYVVDNFRLIFDEEPLQKIHNSEDKYNVFANELQHPEQPESINDSYLVVQDDTNIIHDASNMSNNREEAYQDDQML
nr:putative ribonuclease H-like domain-containing protein [Tanacetum cinerariifolium]